MFRSIWLVYWGWQCCENGTFVAGVKPFAGQFKECRLNRSQIAVGRLLISEPRSRLNMSAYGSQPHIRERGRGGGLCICGILNSWRLFIVTFGEHLRCSRQHLLSGGSIRGLLRLLMEGLSFQSKSWFQCLLHSLISFLVHFVWARRFYGQMQSIASNSVTYGLCVTFPRITPWSMLIPIIPVDLLAVNLSVHSSSPEISYGSPST